MKSEAEAHFTVGIPNTKQHLRPRIESALKQAYPWAGALFEGAHGASCLVTAFVPSYFRATAAGAFAKESSEALIAAAQRIVSRICGGGCEA